jgi:tetratricopeptide (TPR) repeat protein
MGAHNQDHSQRTVEEQNTSGICDLVKTLVLNHDHEQARDVIYEKLNENPNQPDCFFYNARLYFQHKLSGRHLHSKPTFDSLLILYDTWFAASRNPNEVLNWKGRDVRDFYYKQPDSLRKYCAMYKRIYDADKENMHPFNLKMLASCACDLNGKINIDSLWIFTKRQADTHQEAPWKATYKSLKRELISCSKVPCSKLHDLLHPVLSTGKEGSEETLKLHVMLNQRGCSGYEHYTVINHKPNAEPKKEIAKPQVVASVISKPEIVEKPKAKEEPKIEVQKEVKFQETASTETKLEVIETPVPKEEPVKEETAPIAVSIKEEIILPSKFETLYKNGNVNMQMREFATALKNFEEAMNNSNSPIEKADGYLGMALAADSLKDYAKAKEYAMIVHQLLPNEMDGLKFLFQLYQDAEKSCDFATAKERAGFCLVMSRISWDLSNSEESDGWKEKADLTELYNSGKAKKGDKVKVGCIINEEVELP